VKNDNNNLTVLGVKIATKPGADTSRIRAAIEFMEERFESQQQRSRGGQGKDVLLTFMALGMADELLQLKKEREETLRRLEILLSQID